MSGTFLHISRFTALDDLTCKQQADPVAVLRALKQAGRFSVFDATANAVMARMMDRMLHKGMTLVAADGTKTAYGLLLKSTGGAYPWTTVALTEAGERLLAQSPS